MDDDNHEPSGVPPIGEQADTNVPVSVNKPEPQHEAAESAAAKPAEAPKNPDDLSSIDVESGINQPRPERGFTPPKQKRSIKKPLIVLVILLVLGALGFAVSQILKKKDKPASTTPQTAQSASTTPPAAVQKATLKTYKNDTIKIELSYPSDWTVKELTDEVVFTSPSASYTKKDGNTTKGPFRLLVQKGINQVDSSTINASVAVKTSELLDYAAPADGQRKQTYLSFLGKTSDAFSFMLISSGKQFNVGDKVSGTLPLGQDSYIIAGGYGAKADDNLGFDVVSVSKIDQLDAYTQAVTMIKSLKLL